MTINAKKTDLEEIIKRLQEPKKSDKTIFLQEQKDLILRLSYTENFSYQKTSKLIYEIFSIKISSETIRKFTIKAKLENLSDFFSCYILNQDYKENRILLFVSSISTEDKKLLIDNFDKVIDITRNSVSQILDTTNLEIEERELDNERQTRELDKQFIAMDLEDQFLLDEREIKELEEELILLNLEDSFLDKIDLLLKPFVKFNKFCEESSINYVEHQSIHSYSKYYDLD